MDPIRLIQEDTLPLLSGVVSKDDGAPEDITGWVISLHINYPTPLVKVATIPVGTDGYYQFEWETGDLVPGAWEAEIQITSVIGTQTFQRTQDDEVLKLLIHPQIA